MVLFNAFASEIMVTRGSEILLLANNKSGRVDPTMITQYTRSLVVKILLLVAIGSPLAVRGDELEELKATMQSMQKTMEQMQKKISQLEEENHRQKQKQTETATVRTTTTAPSAPAEGPATPVPQVDAN